MRQFGNDDFESMHDGIDNLIAKLSGWSQLLKSINLSCGYLPMRTGHADTDYKGYGSTNKMLTENRLSEAIELARKIKLTAFDVKQDLEAVLKTSQECVLYDPNRKPEPTYFTPDYTLTPAPPEKDRSGNSRRDKAERDQRDRDDWKSRFSDNNKPKAERDRDGRSQSHIDTMLTQLRGIGAEQTPPT
jgi:hypothetical protein